MKRLIYGLILLLMSSLQLTSCAQNKNKVNNGKKMNDKKVLVAYFSRAGENYSVGNVKVGNTQIVAEMIAAETNGDLFKIDPVKAYPADYTKCTEVAKKEVDSKARPAIKADTKAENYDVIFIGYPNWWGDAPMAVYTFIEKHNWQGKTVIPFCTHEGSGLSNANKIQKACKGANMLMGFETYGHKAQNSRAETKASVQSWVRSLNY